MTDEKNNSKQNENDTSNFIAAMCFVVTPSMFIGTALGAYLFDGSKLAVYGGALLGDIVGLLTVAACFNWNNQTNAELQKDNSSSNKFKLFNNNKEVTEDKQPLMSLNV